MSGLLALLPSWSRERLEKTAAARALEILVQRAGDGICEAAIETLVVKMLRHEFTGYDEDQREQAHTAACRAIAAKYPWLAHECDRQRRAAGERLERDLFAAYQEEQEHARESRRKRVEQSREVVGGLVVGISVTARVRGREREARIVKLGRSRVTVEFIIKSGAQRSAVLYACDVHADDARKEAV